MLWYSLNEQILVEKFHIKDIGGSMVIHTFGAYYGVGASFFFQNTKALKSENAVSSYNSNIFAFIGSIFLWMYWPSFNAVLAGSN